MQKVAIIGVGMTDFGELWDKSLRDLTVQAGLEAIRDSGLPGEEIDALYAGCMSSGIFVQQEHIASILADYCGLTPKAATRVEGACASGGIALRQAIMAVASGMYDFVVAGGVEKMTDILTEQTTMALACAADREWEAFQGVTFPGLYAMLARRHMHEFGTTLEQLSQVAVKNHENGAKNPHAQYRRPVTMNQVMKSSLIADPIRLLHCSPISDGAAAVVVASEEKAKESESDPIWVMGTGQASDTIALHDRRTITTMDATVAAGREAYEMAGLTPKDIDLVEVHDCFTIAEITAIEDLGFFEKGEGGKATEEGLTALNSQISINPSGGLKSKGHPVGATGIAQAVEVVMQLRGEAGERQVHDASIGMTHNVGGSGGTCVTHILGR
jgi:acetyl-CoA C-acetyltransferase